jgi:hypothetical protein
MYRPRFATHATNAIGVPDFDRILTHQGTHLDIEREEFFPVEQWAGVLARAAHWALIHRPVTTGRIPIATGNAEDSQTESHAGVFRHSAESSGRAGRAAGDVKVSACPAEHLYGDSSPVAGLPAARVN